MCPDDARSLKHELRTPINHIIGYSALLQESAEDTGDDSLRRHASEVHTIGSELNRVIERTLLFSEGAMGMQDIVVIKAAIAPLIMRITENLSSISAWVADQSTLDDVRRIRSATERLHSLFEDISLSSDRAMEEIHDGGR